MQSGVWVFVGQIVDQACRLLVLIVLARILSPIEFGIVTAAQVVLSVAEMTVRFGVGPMLIQSRDLARTLVRTALSFLVIFSAVASMVLYASAGQLAIWLNIPELAEIVILGLPVLIITVAAIPSMSLLNRELNFRSLALVEVFGALFVFCPLAITLALEGFSYWSLVLATFARQVFVSVVYYVLRPVAPALRLSGDNLRKVTGFGGKVFLGEVCNQIALRGDKLVVASALGVASLGHYGRAYAISDMANSVFGSALYKFYFSRIAADLRKQNDSASQTDALYFGFRWSAALIFPTSVFLWLARDEIVFFLLGVGWGEAAAVLGVMSLAMFFRLGYKISGAFVLAYGAVAQSAAMQMIYAIAVLVSAFIGSNFGLVGVAGGVSVAIVIQFLGLTWLCNRLLGSSWSGLYGNIRGGLLASALVLGICATLESQFAAMGSFYSLIFKGFVIAALYPIFLFVFDSSHPFFLFLRRALNQRGQL